MKLIVEARLVSVETLSWEGFNWTNHPERIACRGFRTIVGLQQQMHLNIAQWSTLVEIHHKCTRNVALIQTINIYLNRLPFGLAINQLSNHPIKTYRLHRTFGGAGRFAVAIVVSKIFVVVAVFLVLRNGNAE